MIFPKHKAGLYLTHNEHKDYYETVAVRVGYHPSIDDEHYWVSPEDKQKSIDTNELWELQWYPDTPVGFHKVCGSTLDIVLKRALEIEEEYLK